ncbi:hypothetical protein JL720_6930 [Aureococcus anophagefferens]|nr:hypothetical protein JL720_6930 [Aureococcus anophagefferens]
MLLCLAPVAQGLAGGGFGAKSKPVKKKKKAKKPPAAPAASAPPPPAAAPPPQDELGAVMALLGSRTAYEARVAGRADELVSARRGVGGGVAVLDGVLGADACAALRREAEGRTRRARRPARRFEADTLAHSVRAYRDDAYRRYALTVWILAAEGVDPRDVLRPERRALSPTDTRGHGRRERAEAGGG